MNVIIDKLKQPSTLLLVVGLVLSFVPGLLVIVYFQNSLFISLDTDRLMLLSIAYTSALYAAIFVAYFYLNLGKLAKMSDDIFKNQLGRMAVVNLFYCSALTTAVVGFMRLLHSKDLNVFIAFFGAVLLVDVSLQMLVSQYPKRLKAVAIAIGLSIAGILVFLVARH